ncbi:MAG: hypothetical protein KAH48_02020, partial [Chlorobi bacterium]|nr:hypothetical protein [Chlorobiota bacterium]
MKTLLLGLFMVFMMLSATVSNALEFEKDQDSWLKTGFPDTEVKLIITTSVDSRLALTSGNELYHELAYDKWEKIDADIEGNVTALCATFLGTDVGLYHINSDNYSFEKIDDLAYANIKKIFQDRDNYRTTYVLTDSGLFFYDYSVVIKCKLPGDNQQLVSMAFSNYNIAAVTESGELFFSNDNCQNWTQDIEKPEEHSFTTVEWDNQNNRFVIGSDKSLFFLNETLEEVQGYNGGYVNCIVVLNYVFVCETGSKQRKPLFRPFPLEDFIAIGTKNEGVYGISLSDSVTQKNDSLGDLNIRSFSYDQWGGYLYAGTKDHGIFRTQKAYAGSVDELNLSPYSLKISPNPAKSRVSISFHNPEYAEIEIA